MRLSIKKAVAAGIAFFMLTGSGTAAWAQESANAASGNKVEIHLTFDDLKSAEWAIRYIASLASKRVFEGYEDGTFKPDNTVSRIEAITAAVRLMGLRSKAESPSSMSTKLNFKDAKQVPAWAVGYVAVALENDLFAENDDSVLPQKAADRLWATTLLVKALKLDAQAKAKMNTSLPFKDGNQIPAGSVGYVAVALEKGLVDGFEDNTFKPNQPVTRAQLAALLDRTGNQLPEQGNNAFTGTVAAPASGGSLAVTVAGATSVYALHPDVFVYRNGAKAAVSALQPGDVVKIRTWNSQILFIEVTQTNQPVLTSGTISAAVANQTITLSKSGTTSKLALRADAVIYRKGIKVKASDLKVGDEVTLRVIDNQVIYIEVTSPVVPDAAKGTVAEAVANNSLKLTNSEGVMTFTLHSDVVVYRNGVKVKAADLKIGDQVDIRTADRKVIYIEVTKMADVPQSFDVTGKLKSTQLNSQGKMDTITIVRTINNKEQTATYHISPDVKISGNMALFVSGHLIQVKGQNNVVTAIVIK